MLNVVTLIGEYAGSWGSDGKTSAIKLLVGGQEKPVLVWIWTLPEEFNLEIGDTLGVKGHIEAGDFFVKVIADKVSVLRVK